MEICDPWCLVDICIAVPTKIEQLASAALMSLRPVYDSCRGQFVRECSLPRVFHVVFLASNKSMIHSN